MLKFYICNRCKKMSLQFLVPKWKKFFTLMGYDIYSENIDDIKDICINTKYSGFRIEFQSRIYENDIVKKTIGNTYKVLVFENIEDINLVKPHLNIDCIMVSNGIGHNETCSIGTITADKYSDLYFCECIKCKKHKVDGTHKNTINLSNINTYVGLNNLYLHTCSHTTSDGKVISHWAHEYTCLTSTSLYLKIKDSLIASGLPIHNVDILDKKYSPSIIDSISSDIIDDIDKYSYNTSDPDLVSNITNDISSFLNPYIVIIGYKKDDISMYKVMYMKSIDTVTEFKWNVIDIHKNITIEYILSVNDSNILVNAINDKFVPYKGWIRRSHIRVSDIIKFISNHII